MAWEGWVVWGRGRSRKIWIGVRKMWFLFYFRFACRGNLTGYSCCCSYEGRVSRFPRAKWGTQGESSCFRSYIEMSRPRGHYFMFRNPRAPLLPLCNYGFRGKTITEGGYRFIILETRRLSLSLPCYLRAKTYSRFINTTLDMFPCTATNWKTFPIFMLSSHHFLNQKMLLCQSQGALSTDGWFGGQ